MDPMLAPWTLLSGISPQSHHLGQPRWYDDFYGHAVASDLSSSICESDCKLSNKDKLDTMHIMNRFSNCFLFYTTPYKDTCVIAISLLGAQWWCDFKRAHCWNSSYVHNALFELYVKSCSYSIFWIEMTSHGFVSLKSQRCFWMCIKF